MSVVSTRTKCEYHLSKTNITAILLTCKRECHCAARRPKEVPEEKTFEQAYAQRGCCHFVKIKNPSFPGHAPGKDTLRAANAATERGQTGENARANAVSGRALSPVKRKRGLRGENGLSVSDYPLSSRHKTLFTITYNFFSLAALSFSRLWV